MNHLSPLSKSFIMIYRLENVCSGNSGSSNYWNVDVDYPKKIMVMVFIFLKQFNKKPFVRVTTSNLWIHLTKGNNATAQSNRSGPRRRPLHQTDHSASPDTRSYSDTNRPMESRQEKGRNDSRDRYSNQWDTDNMAQNLPRCYNCNESNHMVDSCRHRTKVTCFTCNGRGHKAKHCWH